MSTSAPNPVEAATWHAETPVVLTAEAMRILADLALDLLEADGVDIGDGTEALPNE